MTVLQNIFQRARLQTPENHEMRIRLVNGQLLQFTQHEMKNFLWSRNVLFLLGICLFMILITDPAYLGIVPNVKSRLIYWVGTILMYNLALPYWLQMYSTISRWFGRDEMYQPFITFFLVNYFSWQIEFVSSVISPWYPFTLEIGPLGYVRNIFISQIIENVALFWLFPLYQSARNRHAEKTTPDSPPKFVTVGGAKIPFENILWARSSGHYLHLRTTDGDTSHLFSMKDFLAQMDDENGIHSHRSHWVARSAIQSLSGYQIKTKFGENIPVSRGKLKTAQEWMQAQGLPH